MPIELKISAKDSDGLRAEVEDLTSAMGLERGLDDFSLADLIEHTKGRLADLGLEMQVLGGPVPVEEAE